MDGQHEFLHCRAHEVGLAMRMREKLDGGDVRIGVGDAAGHQRARIGLFPADASQPRHEIAQRQDIENHPGEKGRQQSCRKTAKDREQRDEINDDEHQQVRDDQPRVADRKRRLHYLRRDAAGELILVEAHALPEHQPMKIPAQQHREIAEDHLHLDCRLKRNQQDAAREHAAKQQNPAAFLVKQFRGFDLGQPVDDAAQHREEQCLECADRRG